MNITHCKHQTQKYCARFSYACILFMCMAAGASADNARDWMNLPEDLNIVFGYYAPVNVDAPGINVDADMFLFRYGYTFSIDGRTSAIQIVQPYTKLSATPDNARLTGSFINENPGDTQIVFAHNIFGGPSLSKSEFRKWKPGPYLTGAFWLTIPVGQYDNNNVFNAGANRWVFKPELASGYPVGPVWLELNTWATFYTDNDDYLGNNKLSQRPSWAAEGHVSYTLSPELWISLDSSWGGGGETKINDVVQDNQNNNVMLGISLGFQLTPQFGGMVAYSNIVEHREYSPDVDAWTFRLQYAW